MSVEPEHAEAVATDPPPPVNDPSPAVPAEQILSETRKWFQWLSRRA